ncbi:MAG TPA: 4'-phosphopantetheinyl transferase superfamily protein [Gemmatimonadales bacterium]|jgi:hypothetical protein
MRHCGEVIKDVWLGIAGTFVPRARVPARLRLKLDRVAADRALAEVEDASGRRAASAVTSRSHTCGVGAALLAPAGARVGVDLVTVERVGERHARAVLSDGEWMALSRYTELRPSLAWALKEAAAKAGGDPHRSFPGELQIEAGPDRLRVRRSGSNDGEFVAGWGTIGPFLYAWVYRSALSRADGGS